jgi:type VI secretion system protein ImpH
MEAKGGAAGPDLIDRLLTEAHRFTFFQAVQLLQGSEPAGVGVGRGGPPSRECLRFRPVLSLGFPKAELAGIERLTDDAGPARYQMEVALLGLYGTVSPMPTFFTESLLHETGEDSLVRGFLDLFHHRALSLLYRCWEKYRYHVQFRAGGRDEISRRLYCLMGLGGAEPRPGATLPPVHLLRYLGLFSQRPRSAAALGCMLRDYFGGLPVAVTQFVARAVPIPASQKNRLGAANSRLGEDLCVGDRVEDRASSFRIGVGPMGLESFQSLLPGSPGFRALEAMTRLFTTDRLDFEVELILRREEVPELRLCADQTAGRLGHTTWLGSPPEDGRVRMRGPFLAPTG